MTSGKLVNVCISDKKGIPKHAIPSAECLRNHGIVGDAHAGNNHRQISLLDKADIEMMKAKGLKLKPGAFGENLITENIDLSLLGLGSVLQIGDVLLKISQIGKVCHERCAIYYKAGDCIMPRLGIFATTESDGIINEGMDVLIKHVVNKATFQAVVITVSDRCSKGITIDTAGPAVSNMIETQQDFHLAATSLVPDDKDLIVKELKHYLTRNVDLIVTVGGTGFGDRDVTPEATLMVIERHATGLAEAMRISSANITRNAWLQRGVCGIARSTLIVNLPGSEKGAVENLDAIIDVIPHGLKHLRQNTLHSVNDAKRMVV